MSCELNTRSKLHFKKWTTALKTNNKAVAQGAAAINGGFDYGFTPFGTRSAKMASTRPNIETINLMLNAQSVGNIHYSGCLLQQLLNSGNYTLEEVLDFGTKTTVQASKTDTNNPALGNTSQTYLLKRKGEVVGVLYNTSHFRDEIDSFYFNPVSNTHQQDFENEVATAEQDVFNNLQIATRYWNTSTVKYLKNLGFAVTYTDVLPEGEAYPSFLRYSDQKVYGFAKEDIKDNNIAEIFLTKDGLNSGTIVHEYTHLFANVLLKSEFGRNNNLLSTYLSAIISSEIGKQLIREFNLETPDINSEDEAIKFVSEFFAKTAEEIHNNPKGEIAKNLYSDKTLLDKIKDFWRRIKEFVTNGSFIIPENYEEKDVKNLINSVCYRSIASLQKMSITNDEENPFESSNDKALSDVHATLQNALIATNKRNSQKNELRHTIGISVQKAIKLNGGHPLSKTKSGKESRLYKQLCFYYSKKLGKSIDDLEVQTLASCTKAQCYQPTFLEQHGDWINHPENLSFYKQHGYTLAFSSDEDFEPQLFAHGTTAIFESFDPSTAFNPKGGFKIDAQGNNIKIADSSFNPEFDLESPDLSKQILLNYIFDGFGDITGVDIMISEGIHFTFPYEYLSTKGEVKKEITIPADQIFIGNSPYYSDQQNRKIKATLYFDGTQLSRFIVNLPSPIRAIQCSSDLEGTYDWVHRTASNDIIWLANTFLFNTRLNNIQKEILFKAIEQKFNVSRKEANDILELLLSKADGQNYKATSYWHTHNIAPKNTDSTKFSPELLQILQSTKKVDFIAELPLLIGDENLTKLIKNSEKLSDRTEYQIRSIWKNSGERVLHPENFIVAGFIKENGIYDPKTKEYISFDAMYQQDESGQVYFNVDNCWNTTLKTRLAGFTHDFNGNVLSESFSRPVILANIIQETLGKKVRENTTEVTTNINPSYLWALLPSSAFFSSIHNFGTYSNSTNFLDNEMPLDENSLFGDGSILTKAQEFWNSDSFREDSDTFFVFTENLDQFGSDKAVSQTSAIARQYIQNGAGNIAGLVTNFKMIVGSRKYSENRFEDEDLYKEITKDIDLIKNQFKAYLSEEEHALVDSWFNYPKVTLATVIDANFQLIKHLFAKYKETHPNAKIQLPQGRIFNSRRTLITIERCPKLYQQYVNGFKMLKEEFEPKNKTKFFFSKKDIDSSPVHFHTTNSTGYSERTEYNARMSDVTIAFAWGPEGFKSTGEKLTRKWAQEKFVEIDIEGNWADYKFVKECGDKILDIIHSRGLKTRTVNIAGNGITTLREISKNPNLTQKEVDTFITNVLAYVYQKGLIPQTIISGGQSGADEAGTKAAVLLGINAEVMGPKDWAFISEETGKKVTNESKFKARFENTPKVVDLSSVQIPETVYHYADDLTSFGQNLQFTQNPNNYFAQVKGGTANAIFFTDNPNPKSGTTLDRAYQLKVQLNVDPSKVKYVFGTKEQMHQKDSSFTAEVNQAEAEGYEAIRFIGVDDNQEVNQNITVIFDPNNAQIINNYDRKKNIKTQTTAQLLEEDKDDLNVAFLIKYYLQKQGLSESESNDAAISYLDGEPTGQKLATKVLDLVGIRRAQLHQFNLDFNKTVYDENGIIDWDQTLGGVDLSKEIETEEDAQKYTSNLSKIHQLEVHPAEIIMPKIYKSNFHFGDRDINDIDENYFKKAKSFYQSPLHPIENGESKTIIRSDFFIRTHNTAFDVILTQDSLLQQSELLKEQGFRPVPQIKRKDEWRVDKAGKKMYKLPADAKSYMIYQNAKGQEVIVFKAENINDALALIDSTENLVSCQGFFENVNPTEKLLNFLIDHNHISTNNKALHRLIQKIDADPNVDIQSELQKIYVSQEENYKNDLSSTLYNSFLATLQVISVRIPTQAFQSIMAAKVVHLTNDDYNNVFVNRWQFWLQGSDLDIDKSYIMGAEISSSGHYKHWSPLADFTTRQLAEISDTLPVPTQRVLTTKENYYKVNSNYTAQVIEDLGYFDSNSLNKLDGLIKDYLTIAQIHDAANLEVKQLFDLYKIKNDTKAVDAALLKLKSLILLELRNAETAKIHYSEFTKDPISKKLFNRLVNDLNHHNKHIVTDEESRNIIQRNIVRVSLDERNMKAGYSPIDVAMDLFKDALKAMDDGRAYTLDWNNGFTIPYLQYNNSVGKADVGIMANGLKAFFALTQYFNQYRKQLAKNPEAYIKSPRYFLSKLPVINGTKLEHRYCSQLSDIQFEQEAIRALTNALRTFVNTSEVPYESHDDASLLISSLISLATDNAKEMALGKMNASKDLARMHLYLVMLGYSAEEVVTITTSPMFNKLKQSLDASFLSSNKVSVQTCLYKLQADAETAEDREMLQFLEYIYMASSEMSTIAKLGGVNQGVKVDVADAHAFCQHFENIITNQINVLEKADLGPFNLLPATNSEHYLADPFIQEYTQKHGFPRYCLGQMGEFNTVEHTDVRSYISWLTNLNPDEITYELAEKYIDQIQKVGMMLEEQHEQFPMKVNMVKYFNDINYRNLVTEAYELCKMSFNPYDCINHLPHFYEMLHAFSISNETIKMSSKARVALNEAPKLQVFELNNETTKITREPNPDTGDLTPVSKTVQAFALKPIDAATTLKKGYAFYNDKIMSEWLEEHGSEFLFSIVTGVNEDGTKDIMTFDLSTNKGIINFCNFMAHTVIPTLIKNSYLAGNSNSFLKYLRSDFKKISEDTGQLFIPKYKFSFDVGSAASISDQNKIYYLTQGFVDLCLNTNGSQKTLQEALPELQFNNRTGSELPLGELFYLYDKFVTMNSGFSPIGKAFELYLRKVQESDLPVNIAKQLAQIKLEHDLGTRPDFAFDSALFTVFSMQNLIRLTQKGKTEFGRIRDPQKPWKTIGFKQKIDISDTVVFNLQEKTPEQIEFNTNAERFISLIKSGNLLVSVIGPKETQRLVFKTIATSDQKSESFEVEGNTPLNNLNLVEIINYIKSASQETLSDLNAFIKKVHTNLNKNKSLAWKPTESGFAMQLFAEHLQQLGLNVIVDGSGPSYVDAEGNIHINKFDGLTSPMHELMHVVFAVMKNEEYSRFNHLMQQVVKIPQVKSILNSISQIPEYANLMENDKIEEAFNRILEAVCSQKIDPESLKIPESTTSLWEFIKNNINPYITKTFGIPTPSDFTDFLKDTLIRRINNSSVFVRPTLGSTNYIDNKIKVGNMVAVSEFIRQQLDTNGTLEETEC